MDIRGKETVLPEVEGVCQTWERWGTGAELGGDRGCCRLGVRPLPENVDPRGNQCPAWHGSHFNGS